MSFQAFLILLLSFSISSLSIADGLYKWRDARGNIQYGDSPPKNARLENLNMPPLTVIEDYAEQWKSPEEKQINTTPQLQFQAIQKKTPKPVKISYSKLAFIAPKPNQVIHAKDGDVSTMLSIKPPLKAGHKLVFKLDASLPSRKTITARSRIANFTNLNIGYHNLSVEIHDSRGQLIQTSGTVNFRLIRFNSAQTPKN